MATSKFRRLGCPMASTTIPNLPAATSLSGTEVLEIVQSGVSRRVTVSQVAGATASPFLTAPSYTTAQKNALTASPGAIVYDSTLGKLCVYTSSGWQSVVTTP